MLRLRQIRKERGLSYRQLSKASGVPLSTLVVLEQGKGDPQLSTLRKLAAALDVSVSQLIGEKPK